MWYNLIIMYICHIIFGAVRSFNTSITWIAYAARYWLDEGFTRWCYEYDDIRTLWPLKYPASRLFVQQLVQVNNKEKSKFHITGLLCSHQWIPYPKVFACRDVILPQRIHLTCAIEYQSSCHFLTHNKPHNNGRVIIYRKCMYLHHE